MGRLAEINFRLSENSETYSEFILSSILDAVDLLEQFPLMGRIVPETNIHSVRELIIQKYRIIYFVSSSTVVNILSVRHSSRPLSTPDPK